MVRTLPFHGRGHGLDSWLRNQDPTSHMERQKKKKVYSEVVLHLEVGLERIVIFQCGILLAKHKEGVFFFFSIYSNFLFCISVKLQFHLIKTCAC